MSLDLEDIKTVHPADKLAQHSLTSAGIANQKQVAHWLTENSVDAKDVVKNFIENNKRNIEFLFIEDAKPSSEELSKFFSIHSTGVFAEPSSVEQGTSERGIEVNAGKPLLRDAVDVFAAPFLVSHVNQAIGEQPETFVSPNSNELFPCQAINVLHCFVYAPHPAAEFTRRVEVLWLFLGGEPGLILEIHFNHRFGHGIGFAFQIREQLHHSTVERPIDLEKRILRRKVNEKQWHMTEESMGHFNAACVGWGIARSNKLDSINLDPNVVAAPKTPVLNELSHEHDYSLGTVSVLFR
jgi:hypothetical protein